MDYVILIPNNVISTIEGTVGGSNGYYYTKVRTRRSICVVVLSRFNMVVCGDVLQKIGDGLPATNCGMCWGVGRTTLLGGLFLAGHHWLNRVIEVDRRY